jgi:predicted TIM-barrel fold metal-dependent hydrolase
MHVDDLTLISVDDHVVEPADLFTRHLPARWQDQAPRVVTAPTGADMWLWGEQAGMNFGLNAVAGRPPEEYGMNPMSFAEMRDGCYDIHARVRDMDVNGILGSMCFPSFPGFAGRMFHAAGQAGEESALPVLQAYNDWHVDEWCGTYPGRFIPLAVAPIWDQGAMVAEVRRLAAKGCHAFTFSENPEKTGFPSLHNEWWDPFWAACADAGTIVCFHIGSSSEIPITSIESPIDVTLTLMPVNIVQAAADLIWSDFLRRYPLTVSLSEGGIGWVPYFLERVDRTYQHQHRWTGQDFGGKLPSEVFRERVVTCFVEDRIGVELRHEVGLDMITWEVDYPHSDSTWPRSPEAFAEQMADVPDDEVRMIGSENAMRHFRFDPYAHRPPERCTVGALRAEAAGVDVAVRSAGTRAAPPQRPVRVADIAAMSGTRR